MCDVWGLVGYFFPNLSYEEIKLKGNKYIVKRELGRGGFSNVYLVEKAGSHNSQLFALKRVLLASGKKERDVCTSLLSGFPQ